MRNPMIELPALVFLLFFSWFPSARALDVDDLAELVGYTMVAFSNVRGDFEGADFDKPVALDNRMVFEFTTYNYAYAYRPAVAVFARTLTPEEIQRFGGKNIPKKPITLYKLVIEDDVYDVRRIR